MIVELMGFCFDDVWDFFMECCYVCCIWVWGVFVVVVFVVVVFCLVGLGLLYEFVFDEIYYVKDVWIFMYFGYEGIWNVNVNVSFNVGDLS